MRKDVSLIYKAFLLTSVLFLYACGDSSQQSEEESSSSFFESGGDYSDDDREAIGEDTMQAVPAGAMTAEERFAELDRGANGAGARMLGDDTPVQAATASRSLANQGSIPSSTVSLPNRVYFDYDESEIKSTTARVLTLYSNRLKEDPTLSLRIEGHCDERGTREYNIGLGERRANAIRAHLIRNGVPAYRIQSVSFGEERPIAFGSNEGAWARNRRAELIVR